MRDFQPGQILLIECGNTRLYAEVIQVITERQLCWARPLARLDSSDRSFAVSTERIETEQVIVHDLRWGADLLCPLSLFKAALDTDVIPILMYLDAQKAHPEIAAVFSNNHNLLHEFIQCIWNAYPQAFRS